MFEAGDSTFYHQAGAQLSNVGINKYSTVLPDVGYTDLGFPIYISVIYTLFGDYIIIPRIINAILGALTVVLIYKFARRNFGEGVGRLSGIMAMLMPNLIYYCGVHLKETLMIFLLVAFLERADNMIRTKPTYGNVFVVISLAASLFFFRSVLFASALFALFSLLLFVRRTRSNSLQRVIIAIWVLAIFWITFSSRIVAEFEYLIEGSGDQSETMAYMSRKEGGNRLAQYGSSVVFAPIVIIAPIPTFVNIEHQKNQMMLSGGYMVKNVLAFFVIIGIISIIRKKELRKYAFILSFLVAYLGILVQSRFALSERFHLPIIPIFLILAAYGLSQINRKNNKYFLPYLILLTIIIISWNWFKLAGRGVF